VPSHENLQGCYVDQGGRHRWQDPAGKTVPEFCWRWEVVAVETLNCRAFRLPVAGAGSCGQGTSRGGESHPGWCAIVLAVPSVPVPSLNKEKKTNFLGSIDMRLDCSFLGTELTDKYTFLLLFVLYNFE
jgi:hypothetical protein